MIIKMRALGALAGMLSFFAVATTAVGADRAYTEGTVSVVTSLRTMPGMFDNYMKYLSGTYKQLMEEQKKAGIIVDYAVFSARPQGPHDPDVYLIVTYKNLAAMDGLNDRTDAIQERLVGTPEQQSAKMIERGSMRTMVGSQVIRRLDLK